MHLKSVKMEPSSDTNGTKMEPTLDNDGKTMETCLITDGEADKEMHKTSGYIQTVVALHDIRDRAKEAVESLQEKSISERVHEGWNKTRQAVSSGSRHFFSHPEDVPCEHIPEKYNYMFRPKSRWELVLLSGTVCGIEFCYAAETAFVTPILLSLGLNIKFVTMIWCLSPLIGFFLTPVLGSLSDSCEAKFGRRRPFILLLSVGILLGLILVPNGHKIGIAIGDTPNVQSNLRSSGFTNDTSLANITFEGNGTHAWKKRDDSNLDNGIQISPVVVEITTDVTYHRKVHSALDANSSSTSLLDNEKDPPLYHNRTDKRFIGKANVNNAKDFPSHKTAGIHVQPWSTVFTVIGIVLLDFSADACQSPSRTFLLDVSLPEDHTAGLSTFTLMAGLGGSVGYLMGAVHWESTAWGDLLGGQVNAVFMIVAIIFVFCLIATLCSFPEIPLSILKEPKIFREYQQKLKIGEYQEYGNEIGMVSSKGAKYGTASENMETEEGGSPNEMPNKLPEVNALEISEIDEVTSAAATEPTIPILPSEQPTLKEYLRSILHMPKSLRILCLTNLFCWMSLVCYSLYFTDFVGEVVYGGNPQAAEGSEKYKLFQDGVSFGCWGMALYSISCSVYSYFIESLVKRFGAKSVYVGGQLVYCVGMIGMAAARHPVAVILLSPTAGVMYSTLFTMPYLLIAHYHYTQKFRDDKNGGECGIRGIGTDVAVVSSMVFLSQFILSLSVGSIVDAVGSKVATVCAASFLSACGAISATQVMYLEM